VVDPIITEEQTMINPQSSDTQENNQETNKSVITEFGDPIQYDPQEPLIPIDSQHTITEQLMRSRYGPEIKK
jgi:hypothetical protein